MVKSDRGAKHHLGEADAQAASQRQPISQQSGGSGSASHPDKSPQDLAENAFAPEDQISDCELVSQLQKGNLEALGELYHRHRHLVYRTALAITGDREPASDLLQDVFLRLHRFADHIDPKRPLEPWLYRVTANLAYSWVRRNQRGTRLIEEIATRLLGSSDGRSPHELAEKKDEMDQVRQALMSLPLQQRVVVVMYYLNGLTVGEIAETLNVPVGTVKSRLHYGRRSLQSNLDLQHLAKVHNVSELNYESL